MKTCKAIIFQQSGIRKCPNPAKTGKHFCLKHRHYLQVVIILPIIGFMLTYWGYKLCDHIFISDTSSFPINIHVVDWNNRIDNQEIYDKNGIIYFDGKKEYSEEITSTNKGKITFNLPASYDKNTVRVHLENPQYKFMKLDTIIRIDRKSSTYDLKMYFDGIDKITRRILDSITHKPVIGAIVEIKEEKAITDNDGQFTITLPLSKQERFQKLVIKKEGYVDYINNKFNVTNHNPTIFWDMRNK